MMVGDKVTYPNGATGQIIAVEPNRQKEIDRLPPPDTTRWVMRRKAQVVQAVRDNLLTAQQACDRYSLSEEELESWAVLLYRHGIRGLRATRIQNYRGTRQKEIS